MRFLFAAILTALALSGCASDPADRAFFGGGWLLPERGADQRMMRQDSAFSAR